MGTIGTIIAALIMGCIVGPLARLILPGRQNISTVMTIVLGGAGALIGTLIGLYAFGWGDGDVFSWSGLLLGAGVAALLVLAYGAVTGRDNTHNRVGR